MKVVVDTGPIVVLAKAGHLALLPQLFDAVIVPKSVMEGVAGRGEKRPGAEIANRPRIQVKSDPIGQQAFQERQRLGDGEAEAIAIARQEVSGTYLLIDDHSGARTAAFALCSKTAESRRLAANSTRDRRRAKGNRLRHPGSGLDAAWTFQETA